MKKLRKVGLVSDLKSDFIDHWTFWSRTPTVLNVTGRPFGAVGDGSADDADAINLALASAASTPGAIVYLPATETGIYRISSPLVVPPLVTLKAAIGTSIRLHTSFSGVAVIVSKAFVDNETANQGGFAIQNVQIIGNPSASGTYDGIRTFGQDTEITQCMISEVSGHGIRLSNVTANGNRVTPGVNFNRQVVRDCRIHTTGGNGITLDGPTDCYIINNHINETEGHGIGMSTTGGTVSAGGYQIIGNHISEAGAHGIYTAYGGTGLVIAHNNIENFGVDLSISGVRCGIIMYECTTHGVVCNGNSMWCDEDNGSSTYYMIYVTSVGDSNVQVVVSNNFARGNLGAVPILVYTTSPGTSINCQVSNNHMHRVIDPLFNVDFIRSNENSWDYGNAPPTGGSWRRSMRRWDDTASAAGIPGWICTTAGTPGTWKAMAALAA